MKLNNAEIEILLKKYNKGESYPLQFDDFVMNCQRYLKANKECRMICSIGSVSSSGMSRTIKFFEMSKGGNNKHFLLNFYRLFCVLGYQKINHSDYFRINGCGMDMVFHTNYSIIHQLHNLGFINKKQCDSMAQNTPHLV